MNGNQSVLQPCSVDDYFIPMQELSDSIEEIVSTPDVYYIFNLPINNVDDINNVNTEICDKKNAEYIRTQIFHELVNNEVEFMGKSNHSNNVTNPVYLDEDVHMNQNSSVFNEYQNIVNQSFTDREWKIDDGNTTMETKNEFRKMFRTQHSGLCAGMLPQKIEGKSIKSYTNYSNLIILYCATCKKALPNYTDKQCPDCQSLLLFQCNNCNCLYKRLVSIQNHIKYECNKKSYFYCADCTYKCLRKVSLVKHVQNVHNVTCEPDNYLKCSICFKKFKNKNNLVAHEQFCSMEPTFQCKYCSFKSKFSRGLTVHVNLRHQKSNVQNYTCSNCGKTFKNTIYLNRHIRELCKFSVSKSRHQELECDHCSYRTNRKYALAKHIQQNHSHLFLKDRFVGNLNNWKREVFPHSK